MEQPQPQEQKSPTPPPPSQNGSAVPEDGDRDKSRRLMSEALQREDEFLEYLMSLSTTAPAAGDSGSAQDSGVAEEEEAAAGPVRSASGSSQPVTRTAGLDHLDNLCKLMEQLGDLKEQNTKLQRRVQYLEDLKRLQLMHKQLRAEDGDCGRAQAAARAAAGGGGGGGGEDRSGRGRSRSVGVHVQPDQQRQSPQKTKAKVSKWTKVKEAFRWERAAFADHGHGHHQQQSHQQHKSNAARLAAAAAATAATRASPSTSSSSSDDLDIHMHFSEIFPDTGGPGSSGGGSVSAAESRRLSLPEEERDEEARRSRSLDADAITSQLSGKDMSPLSKSPSGKAHRTPWGKVKDIIIQTRKDSLKRRGAGAGSTDAHLDSASDGAADASAPQSQDADGSKAGQAPRLTLTLASSEELRWPEHPSPNHRPPPKPSPSPVTDPEDDRRHNQQGSPPPCRRHSSKWTKVKKAFLTARQEDAGSPPYSPRDHAAFEYAAQTGEGDEATREKLQAEIQRSYEELQHKLSIEFQEKLAEWERARLAVAASSSAPGGGEAGTGGGAVLGPEEQSQLVAQALQQRAADKCFRRKMDEWERIRHHQHPLSADFRKKLTEWQRRKEAGPGGGGGGRHASLPGAGLAGEGGGEGGSPRAARKPNKELLWLEKELHKIAREKQRLERERDKFLQREARLEKMRSALRAGHEVLVQTATGSFRFQGISEAFTRRLYEWEQARGIGPEHSTFALLDPRYRPRPRQPAAADQNGRAAGGSECAPLPLSLSRCKSAGSVATPAGLSLTRQASSLSLNDAQLESSAAAAGAAPALEDGRAVSEPRLRTDALEEGDGDGEEAEDGPSAVIVDVEDEVVETAGPLAAAPAVLGHTPVYCYAPREVTTLIDSSGSESDRDHNAMGGVCRNESVRTERSYRLLDENVDLLNKLKNNEDVCRKLEAEIEELEAKMEEAARNREQQLQNLEKASEARQVALLRARVRELERRHERLKRQGATLQDSFAARSEQQAALACHLVGNMKQLQLQGDPLAFVRDLSTQVLQLSEQLAAAVLDRGGCSSAATRRHRLASGLTWLSADGISLSAHSLQDECPEGRQELRELPALLTSKVLELKRGLSFLCGTDRSGNVAAEEARAAVRSRRNARQSQVQGAASSGSDSDEDDDDDDEGDGSAQPAQAAAGGTPAAFYETEVPPASKAGCYRHKKLLRARRVSDTHVGYRVSESPGASRHRDTDDSDTSANDSDRRSAPRSRSRLADSEGGSPRAGRVYALAENGTGRNSTCEEDTEECRQSEKEGGLPELRHRIVPAEPEGAFVEEREEEEGEPGEEEDAPTNVFVKTTRKIFSPVRRDSKGKASSVIGFVVGDSVNGVRGNRGSRRESVDSGGREKKEHSAGAGSGGSVPESPARLARQSRSQSSSPAVVRRPSTASKEGSSSADTSSTGCDSKAADTGPVPTPPERLSVDRDPDRGDRLEESAETPAKAGRNKAPELVALDHIPPPTGLPPLSHSPMSSRRGGSDQPRPPAKETAPSIRMMIAKYNKNLEGASVEASGAGGCTGGAAPNGTPTSGGSPVAWRSPATERRVHLQMEKYQEEVRRALESGGVPNTGSGRHVQKSASVGFIPASPVSRSAGGGPRKPPSGAAAAVHTKGILKSSSASAIQADLSQRARVSPQETANESSVVPPPAPFEDSSAKSDEAGPAAQAVTPQPVRAVTHSASASPLSLLRPSISPATSNPSSPELVQRKSADGGASLGSSPPPSRLRALRLKRAKEEFLTRGPASRSWTASPTASGGEASPPPPAPLSASAAGYRLSFAGSADGSPLRPASAGRAAHAHDEAQLLVKSASAGAISPSAPQPAHRAPDASGAAATSSNKAPRFGLASSIASRFRKVKMRRAGRGHGQQGAVSALCRQSLLVDLGGDAAERAAAAAAAAPATKSCPSSPVLRRPPQPPPPRPPASPTNDDDSKSSCWVKKKIFRPKS